MLTSAQAELWSRQPDSAKAQRTHEQIRAALHGPRSKIRHRTFEDFLQGSYRSDTNITGDSDVDIVARLDEPFHYDVSRLSPFWAEQQLAQFAQPDYSFEQFRLDTYETLREVFGDGVKLRNKCIEVPESPSRLRADVVPCMEHRVYAGYEAHTDGIAFRPINEQRWVVNYPRQHYENGVRKHAITTQRFKPVVRMLKNARNHQIDRGRLSPDISPSYFMQCLTYNASDGRFGPDLVASYYAVLRDVQARLNNPASMICENEIVPLFGSTPEQWTVANAATTVEALLSL